MSKGNGTIRRFISQFCKKIFCFSVCCKNSDILEGIKNEDLSISVDIRIKNKNLKP